MLKEYIPIFQILKKQPLLHICSCAIELEDNHYIQPSDYYPELKNCKREDIFIYLEYIHKEYSVDQKNYEIISDLSESLTTVRHITKALIEEILILHRNNNENSF